MPSNKKLFTPAGWQPVQMGTMDSVMVKADGRWFAQYDDTPGRVIGRALNCRRFYRKDFAASGVTEERIIVAEDGTFKFD